jgi:hypothetical protein
MKNLRSPLTLTFFLATVALAATAFAVEPPPDGGYANFNTAEGQDALFSLTSGISNTAVGYNTLYFNTDGTNNTAIGTVALFNNTTGFANTATGDHALNSNTEGVFNTATGISALGNNTTGNNNTANGGQALWFNLTGSDNTATGLSALQSNTTGSRNTATGEDSLLQNTTGNDNSATGFDSLAFNNTGIRNTADGSSALHNNTSGGGNTALGSNALFNNSTGLHNIAVGDSAGFKLTTGSDNIEIGNQGNPSDVKTIRIGARQTHQSTFIAGISGVTVAGGVNVVVDTSGQLGTVTSSARYKEAIQPMARASEAIWALQPVTFRYKHELDPKGIPQFGLVAEQVEKVNPDLVARDDQGKPYTVRYEAVNAMLLNEFLKEHRKVEGLEAAAAQQQKEIGALTAALKAQAAQIQKVSDQLEADTPSPRVVADN